MHFSNVFCMLTIISAGTVSSEQIQRVASQITGPATNNKHIQSHAGFRHRRREAERSTHHSFRGIKKRFVPEDPSVKVISADAGILPTRRQKNEGSLMDERFLQGSGAATCDSGYVECDDGWAVINGTKSTTITCKDECDNGDGSFSCCDGKWCYSDYCCEDDGCKHFTGRVCRDGSCRGGGACQNANIDYVVDSCKGNFDSCRGSQIHRAVGSCVGYMTCWDAQINYISNSCFGYLACEYAQVNYISNSCVGSYACAFASGCGDIVDSCNEERECKNLEIDCDPPLEWVGNNGGPAFPLGRCQGDCDKDTDCQGDLVCFNRDGDTADAPVPGCSGYDDTGDDFCTVRPSETYLAYMGNSGVPADKFPLKLCEGDCDNDSECDGELVCFNRNGRTPVPGCEGAGMRGKDYCHNDAD